MRPVGCSFVLLIFFFLLLSSAMFSAAETAFTSISASSVYKLALTGDRRAQYINFLNKRKELVISTLLVGNTVVNIASSSVATAMLLELLGPEGILVSTFAVTFLILLFSEALPKTYAIQNPESTSLRMARFVLCCSFILAPLASLIQCIVDCILKLLGMRGRREIVSAADAMRNLILLHNRQGTMLKQDLDMLSSVLDLAETEISQVMTHRKNLFSLDIDQDIDTLLKQIFQSSHSRIPLWRKSEESIVGVIHVRDVTDLVRSRGSQIAKSDIYKVMTKPWFIPDTTPLSVQLHNFRKRRRHMALVVDEYGTLQGAVTLEDILEEIVGDISDEHDIVPANPVTVVGNGEYNISGDAPVRDINRELGWSLPEEASTLAGLLLHDIERIPEEGEVFHLYGFSFEILKKNGNAISLIKVNVPAGPSS